MALVCDFQSCCTASILYGFGQEEAADGAARREGNGKTYEQTRNSIIQRVKQKQGERDGLVTAITTNNQVNAIKALTELGFKNSGEVEKLRHPENTICLWWLPLKDWVEPKVEVAAPVVKNVFAQQAEIRADFADAEQRVVDMQVERPRRLLGYYYKIGERTYLSGTKESGYVSKAIVFGDRKLYTNSQQADKTNILRRQMRLPLITVEAVYEN